jgi:hypothetical protein
VCRPASGIGRPRVRRRLDRNCIALLNAASPRSPRGMTVKPPGKPVSSGSKTMRSSVTSMADRRSGRPPPVDKTRTGSVHNSDQRGRPPRPLLDLVVFPVSGLTVSGGRPGALGPPLVMQPRCIDVALSPTWWWRVTDLCCYAGLGEPRTLTRRPVDDRRRLRSNPVGDQIRPAKHSAERVE